MSILIPEKVKEIMASLNDHGFEAYVIGGAVRDIMIGERPADWDIFTNGSGSDIFSIFPDAKVIGSEERRTKILTTIVKKHVEVSSYRSNGDRTDTGVSLEQHLSTCDFTINSMAMNIDMGIIDNHYGMVDIRNNVVRCVGDAKERICEDKIRAFRAIRFAVKYGFRIDKDLSRVIFNMDISELPIERVREEILKIIMFPGGLEMLYSSNLLDKVIPEFEPSMILEGGIHHDENVGQHMFNAQDISCMITDNPILVFACAMHDIGKASVQIRNEKGNMTFHGHDNVGAKMVQSIMKRMKFSNADIMFASTIVAEHMFSWNNDVLDKTLVKHFGNLDDSGVSIYDYMIMKYADYHANERTKRVKFGDYIAKSDMFARYYGLKFSCVPFNIRDLAISGDDVINAGVPAGIMVGSILDRIFEDVMNGNLRNKRNELMQYLKHDIMLLCNKSCA